MTFARAVFFLAGVWGIVVLSPIYSLVDITGRHYAPPTVHPQFFYGFLITALAWQVAFLVIGWNPARFRTLMIPAMIEKFGYVATVAVLHSGGRIGNEDAMAAIPDFILGLLFMVAFAKTPPWNRG